MMTNVTPEYLTQSLGMILDSVVFSTSWITASSRNQEMHEPVGVLSICPYFHVYRHISSSS